MTWPFGDHRPLSFATIMADPPWYFHNYSAKGEAKNAVKHYACMELSAIKALPVGQLAAGDAVCIMWATAPMLPQALEVMAAWGFRFSSAGAWAKQSSTGASLAFGPGYDYRSAAEFWLLGKVGNPKPLVHDVRNLILAPVREHSRKPDQMRADIERQWPGPRIELFARQTAPGWSAWGNQVDRFQPEGTEV